MKITRSLERRIAAYRFRHSRNQRKINALASARVVCFILIVLGFSFIFDDSWSLQGAATFIASSGVFLYLMVLQDRCYRAKSRYELVIQLLEDDLARAEWRFDDIQQKQRVQFEDGHPFAHDLDLTSRISLLALIDTTFHERARTLIKGWIDEASSVEEIRMRQAAVADLSGRRRFRHQLALSVRYASVPGLNAGMVRNWLDCELPWTLGLKAYIGCRVLALVTTTAVVSHFFFGTDLPYLPWFPWLALQVTLFYVMDRVHRQFNMTFMQRGKEISAVCAAIRTLEQTPLEAPLLQELKASLLVANEKAGKSLTRLTELHDYLAYRSNGFAHIFLNGMFLWDQHFLFRLAGWRERYGEALPIWIEAIFKVEALAALGNYHELFGGPFPELVDGDVIHIEAKGLAHPCLSRDSRVGNDYRLTERGVLHLVTGSNMSGKSTFLRTVGVNLVLARMGAPVCGEALTCSLPRIWTSIHIQDSLAQGVSYFYAEVRRIKLILDEILADPRPVFYLMDEILKGTNSRERLIATRAMVYFLLEHQASGLITTHDLEMLGIVKERPAEITNYHFQERVENDQMFFDYQLKDGELTSTNALRVMRHAGVPLQFEE